MQKPQINEFLMCVESVADGTRPTNNNTWGLSVTPTNGAYGSFASIGVLSSTYDVYEWSVGVHSVGISATSRLGMISIYADPAGGTSYTVPIVADLAVGASVGQGSTPAERHNSWRFRRRIPAGWSIGIKASVQNATVTAIKAWIFDAMGRPSRPDIARTHEYCDAIGATGATTCQGVAITPGTTAEGAWTAIGTLARDIEWIEYTLCLDDATSTAQGIATDIAIGDASNKKIVILNAMTIWTAAETCYRPGPSGRATRGVAGQIVYARAQSGAALDDGVYSVAVYGCGG